MGRTSERTGSHLHKHHPPNKSTGQVLVFLVTLTRWHSRLTYWREKVRPGCLPCRQPASQGSSQLASQVCVSQGCLVSTPLSPSSPHIPALWTCQGLLQDDGGHRVGWQERFQGMLIVPPVQNSSVQKQGTVKHFSTQVLIYLKETFYKLNNINEQTNKQTTN